jgi:hypothetical protein
MLGYTCSPSVGFTGFSRFWRIWLRCTFRAWGRTAAESRLKPTTSIITLSIPEIYDISVLMKEICHGITGRGAHRGGVVCCSNFFILKVSTNLLIGLTRMFEAWGSLAAF